MFGQVGGIGSVDAIRFDEDNNKKFNYRNKIDKVIKLLITKLLSTKDKLIKKNKDLEVQNKNSEIKEFDEEVENTI